MSAFRSGRAATAIPTPTRVAVIIPAYRVRAHVLEVLRGLPSDIWRVYVVDDACHDGSGRLVGENARDPRVRVIYHDSNQGVGGAVMTGYRAALVDGADVLVKVDGDGQMDPRLVPHFVRPIVLGMADYVKGNRFFDLEQLGSMPSIRIFGNAVLSFLAKLSTGYWGIFDPTNGYTAIDARVARLLPFHKISRRYFFETDILFRLGTLRAVVVDLPMEAVYRDEESSLRISRIVGPFLVGHLRNFGKRIFYNYYLRDMSIASIELPLGLAMIFVGTAFGLTQWSHAAALGVSVTAGTVMLSALPLLIGINLVLAFLSYDIASVPHRPIGELTGSLTHSEVTTK